MAYDQKIDKLKSDLVTATGASASLDIAELWNRLLIARGVTGGTLLDRMARDAAARMIPLGLYQAGQFGSSLGPEMVGQITDSVWGGIITPFTATGALLEFGGTDAGARTHTIDTEDNVTYRIQWTISDYVSGSFRWQLYGETTAHLGQTSTVAANGSYSEDIVTNTAGSQANQIRANAVNGAAGSNFYDVTITSIRKVI